MKRTFTLIELIVVIAIIAILAAIIAPNAFKAIEKAKITKTAIEFKSAKAAAQAYYADVGAWPWYAAWGDDEVRNDNGTGFIDDDGAPGWDGPYLLSWPRAEWITSNTSFKYFYYMQDWDENGKAESHLVWLGNETTSLTVPEHIRIRLDEILDDGNLTTGRMQMHNPSHDWFNYCIVD